MSDSQWEVWEPYSKQWTWGTGSSKMVTLEDIAKQQLVISSSAFRHPDMFYQLTWTQWLTNKQKRTFPTFYIYMGTGTYCTIKLLCVCNVLFASYFRTWYSKASNTNVLYYCEIMNLIIWSNVIIWIKLCHIGLWLKSAVSCDALPLQPSFSHSFPLFDSNCKWHWSTPMVSALPEVGNRWQLRLLTRCIRCRL